MNEFENSIHNCLAGDEELTAISTRFFNILQEEESELLIENFDDEQIFQQIEVNRFFNMQKNLFIIRSIYTPKMLLASRTSLTAWKLNQTLRQKTKRGLKEFLKRLKLIKL